MRVVRPGPAAAGTPHWVGRQDVATGDGELHAGVNVLGATS